MAKTIFEQMDGTYTCLLYTSWYDALTEEQLSELKTWYRAWLDGTNTQTIPEKPEWLT